MSDSVQAHQEAEGVSMAGATRVELEERCQKLLADGQQVTSRLEQILQRSPVLMEVGQFDRTLERLRREGDDIHRKLEHAMAELQALDG